MSVTEFLMGRHSSRTEIATETPIFHALASAETPIFYALTTAPAAACPTTLNRSPAVATHRSTRPPIFIKTPPRPPRSPSSPTPVRTVRRRRQHNRASSRRGRWTDPGRRDPPGRARLQRSIHFRNSRDAPDGIASCRACDAGWSRRVPGATGGEGDAARSPAAVELPLVTPASNGLTRCRGIPALGAGGWSARRRCSRRAAAVRATTRRNRYVVAMTPASAPTAMKPTAPSMIKATKSVLTTRPIHARRDAR
jgi:hypothetical protein